MSLILSIILRTWALFWAGSDERAGSDGQQQQRDQSPHQRVREDHRTGHPGIRAQQFFKGLTYKSQSLRAITISSLLLIRSDPLVGGIDPDPDLSIILLSSSKKVRKTLIATVLWLFLDFLTLKKNDVNVPSTSNKQKNFFVNYFFVCVLKVCDENSRIRIH